MFGLFEFDLDLKKLSSDIFIKFFFVLIKKKNESELMLDFDLIEFYRMICWLVRKE